MKQFVSCNETFVESVCCPSCGKGAVRRLHSMPCECPGNLLRQVACPECDYFLEICELNGKVMQAYF